MKRKVRKVILAAVIILGITMLTTGCSSTPPVNQIDMDTIVLTKNPGENESVIVIQRKSIFTGSMIPMKVWINDEEAVSGIGNGSEVQLVLANGEYTIQAGSTGIDKGNKLSFIVENDVIVFSAEPKMGLLAARFDLAQAGKTKL